MSTFDLYKYTNFIKGLLKTAKINSVYREKLTQPAPMKIFVQATIHETIDPVNNYEKLEFIGDGIIKAINSQYIPLRFPNVNKEGDLSKIRRYLEKEKTLAKLADKLGFWEFAQADADTLATKKIKTLEDMFEAFIGALVQVLDTFVKRGLGYNYAYNFMENIFNDMEISLSKEDLDDAITRLNELYKAANLADGRPGLRWGDAIYNNKAIQVPKVSQLPATGQPGQLVFLSNGHDNSVYIYNGTARKWVSGFFNVPLIPFVEPPQKPYVKGADPDPTIQLVWFSKVYGFLDRTPKFTTVTKQNAQLILENPAEYGAKVIGQAFAFKNQNAKMAAATAALAFLKAKGIYKG